MTRKLGPSIVLIGLLFTLSQASAQWSRVTEVQDSVVFSVFAVADTIVAGLDTTTYVSTNGGATWKHSVPVAPDVTMILATSFHNGRLYAGTYGQGVFVSDDLGDSWTAYNQGLVGGILNSQLYIVDFLVHDDKLLAATCGAGAWIRDLAEGSTWSHFGDAFEPNQASDMTLITAGGTRLFAAGGFNGIVFWRDPGDADWTLSYLNNVGVAPGLNALSAIWTGTGWVVGSDTGVFRSLEGHEPWSFANPGPQPPFSTCSLVLRGHDVFANFTAGSESDLEISHDDGATWQLLESTPSALTFKMALSGDDLYSGRQDGLWRRPITTASASPPSSRARLRFAIAGAQPGGNRVLFRLDLVRSAPVVIDVFDVSGRRRAVPVHRTLAEGPNEIVWDARELPNGIYFAQATAEGEHATARLVHIR